MTTADRPTTEIVAHTAPRLRLSHSDIPDDFAQLQVMARTFAASKVMPVHLRGDEPSIVVMLMAARSLDLQSLFGLQQLHEVKGKIGMSGQLMQALALRHEVRFEWLEISSTAARCVIHRPGEAPTPETSFTIDDAIQAGLASRQPGGKIVANGGTGVAPWQGYTEDMLFWRCTSRASRRYLADVLLGMAYLPEELVAEEAKPTRATAIRVDADTDLQQLVVRAMAADNRQVLREVHARGKELNVLDRLTPAGITLRALIRDRGTGMPADTPAPTPTPEPLDGQVMPPPPAAPSPPQDVQDAEEVTLPPESSPAPAETLSAAGLAAAEADFNRQAGSDGDDPDDAALAAAEAADFDATLDGTDTTPPVPDSETSRQDTARRRGVLAALVEKLGSEDAVAALCFESWGLSFEESSTHRVSELLLQLNRSGQ